MTVALTVVLLASFKLMTCDPAVFTADTGRKAVATGLIVTCLGVSSAGATALVTTAACSGALGGEKRTAAEAGNDKMMSQTPSRTLSAQKAFFHS